MLRRKQPLEPKVSGVIASMRGQAVPTEDPDRHQLPGGARTKPAQRPMAAVAAAQAQQVQLATISASALRESLAGNSQRKAPPRSPGTGEDAV